MCKYEQGLAEQFVCCLYHQLKVFRSTQLVDGLVCDTQDNDPALLASWQEWLGGWMPMQETQEMWVRSLGSEHSPEEEHSNPLQYFCLENPMDRGAWQATVQGLKAGGEGDERG